MTTRELLLQSIAKDIRQLHPLDDEEIDLLRRAAGLKSDERKIIVDGLAKIDVVVPEVAVEFMLNLLTGIVIRSWAHVECVETP
jgi:hypothetical protein